MVWLSCLPKIYRCNPGVPNPFAHGLRTPREEIAFTARPKTQSQSQIFRYGGSIFCLPHRPNFSDIFDLCFHWVSVVRVCTHSMYVYLVRVFYTIYEGSPEQVLIGGLFHLAMFERKQCMMMGRCLPYPLPCQLRDLFQRVDRVC